jgi:hypothetical protein
VRPPFRPSSRERERLTLFLIEVFLGSGAGLMTFSYESVWHRPFAHTVVSHNLSFLCLTTNGGSLGVARTAAIGQSGSVVMHLSF